LTTTSEPTAAGTPPAPAPAPAKAAKPAAAKPNHVTPVRPVATAAANVVNVVVATAVYTHTAPVLAAVAAVGVAGTAAAAGGAASCLRINTQPSTSTLTPNKMPSFSAHMGNRRRGAATFTSNSAGAAWR